MIFRFSSGSEDQNIETFVFRVWCCGNFRGLSQTETVIDGYARCLLCRADLSIGGLSSLWDHWRGADYTRLEQKYRIMTRRPLLDKSCRAVPAEEDRCIRRERISEPSVFMESELRLTVDERIAIEEADEEGQRPQLPVGIANYLWSFGGVLRLVDAWCDCTPTELRFDCRTLNYPRCQVGVFFIVTVVGYILRRHYRSEGTEVKGNFLLSV